MYKLLTIGAALFSMKRTWALLMCFLCYSASIECQLVDRYHRLHARRIICDIILINKADNILMMISIRVVVIFFAAR